MAIDQGLGADTGDVSSEELEIESHAREALSHLSRPRGIEGAAEDLPQWGAEACELEFSVLAEQFGAMIDLVALSDRDETILANLAAQHDKIRVADLRASLQRCVLVIDDESCTIRNSAGGISCEAWIPLKLRSPITLPVAIEVRFGQLKQLFVPRRGSRDNRSAAKRAGRLLKGQTTVGLVQDFAGGGFYLSIVACRDPDANATSLKLPARLLPADTLDEPAAAAREGMIGSSADLDAALSWASLAVNPTPKSGDGRWLFVEPHQIVAAHTKLAVRVSREGEPWAPFPFAIDVGQFSRFRSVLRRINQAKLLVDANRGALEAIEQETHTTARSAPPAKSPFRCSFSTQQLKPPLFGGAFDEAEGDLCASVDTAELVKALLKIAAINEPAHSLDVAIYRNGDEATASFDPTLAAASEILAGKEQCSAAYLVIASKSALSKGVCVLPLIDPVPTWLDDEFAPARVDGDTFRKAALRLRGEVASITFLNNCVRLSGQFQGTDVRFLLPHRALP